MFITEFVIITVQQASSVVEASEAFSACRFAQVFLLAKLASITYL